MEVSLGLLGEASQAAKYGVRPTAGTELHTFRDGTRLLRRGTNTYGGLHEALNGVALLVPDVGEVLAHLEGDEPQVEADGHGHDGVDDDQVPSGLEPAPASGGQARERDDECNEGEDGVGDTGYTQERQ